MSRIYTTTEQFEAVFNRMFEQIATEQPNAMDRLVAEHMVICFRLRDPDTELWVDGRELPVETSFGPQMLDPTFTASLSGDTMHQLLLGTLPLGRAVLFRKLKLRGSNKAAIKLEELLHALQAAYPAIADEMLGDG